MCVSVSAGFNPSTGWRVPRGSGIDEAMFLGYEEHPLA